MLWFWGFVGAFMYAGPRLVRCWITCREKNASRLMCYLDFVMCLAVGASAGAAFSSLLLTYWHLKDQNGISAVIGVFANPVIPVLTKRVPKVAGTLAGILGDLKGDGK